MICGFCGKEFEQTHGLQKYCSYECKEAKHKEKMRMQYVGKREQSCVICGADLPKHKTRYCSDRCSRRAEAIRAGTVLDHGLLTKTCIVCGKEFQTFKSRKCTCSNECFENNHRRDKRYKGITVDPDISLFKLAERDHDICQLCGLEVNWGDKCEKNGHVICGKMYPSIDHIRPISLGGFHSWDNVQLAHISCNSKKHNRFIG